MEGKCLASPNTSIRHKMLCEYDCKQHKKNETLITLAIVASCSRDMSELKHFRKRIREERFTIRMEQIMLETRIQGSKYSGRRNSVGSNNARVISKVT